MADLGVDEGEKAWSQEAIVHACDDEGIYLDSSSGQEDNLKLKVVSEVKCTGNFEHGSNGQGQM